jgi:hypothetical protein
VARARFWDTGDYVSPASPSMDPGSAMPYATSFSPDLLDLARRSCWRFVLTVDSFVHAPDRELLRQHGANTTILRRQRLRPGPLGPTALLEPSFSSTTASSGSTLDCSYPPTYPTTTSFVF